MSIEELRQLIEQTALQQAATAKTVDQLGQRMDQLGERVDQLGERMDQLGERVDQLGERMDQLGERMDQLGERVDRVSQTVDRVAETVRISDQKVTRAVDIALSQMSQFGDFAELVRAIHAETAQLKRAIDYLLSKD